MLSKHRKMIFHTIFSPFLAFSGSKHSLRFHHTDGKAEFFSNTDRYRSCISYGVEFIHGVGWLVGCIPLGPEGIRSGTEVAEERPSYQASTNAGPSTQTLSPATPHLSWRASVTALLESLRCSDFSLSAIASDSGFCLSYLQ